MGMESLLSFSIQYALTNLSFSGNLAQLFSPHSSEFLSDLEKFDNTIVKLHGYLGVCRETRGLHVPLTRTSLRIHNFTSSTLWQ